MKKAELFKCLSNDQKKEFEKDINSAIDNVIASKKIQSAKLNNVRIHLRLENKIFLHVSMTIDYTGQIIEDNFDVTRFKNVDRSWM